MIINRKKDTSMLRCAFSKVFNSKDPFGKMFCPSISHKVLLYPTDGYYLSEQQFSVLSRALEMIGESSYYLSEIEGAVFLENPSSSVYQAEHLELSVHTLHSEYIKQHIILENALYSPSGKWGCIISHEDHAVIGGSEKFIAIVKELYPDWKDDQIKFIEAFEYWSQFAKTDLSWISDFLKYINE